MVLEKGDMVAGDKFAAGIYVGKEKINGAIFYKVRDLNLKVNHFIHNKEFTALRKLPSKQTVLKHLSILTKNKFIDVDSIDGPRYHFYKEKLKKSSFKDLVEVLNDLNLLKKNKKASISEVKLLKKCNEKLFGELEHILASSEDQIREEYSLVG